MKTNMHFGASNRIFTNAKHLRNHPSYAERLLWAKLRNNQLGVHFRRQHPMIDFSVDFYCHEVELVVEVDGSVHLEPTVQLEDATKQLSLEAVGITVIRFTNTDVIERMEKVLTEIKSEIERLKWIQGQNT